MILYEPFKEHPSITALRAETARMFNELYKQNNMKQIKMSLETARKMWRRSQPETMLKKNDGSSFGTDDHKDTRDWLLENFTKQELEGKEGFVWEDVIANNGFSFHEHNVIFKSRKQLVSAMAFSQLTYIVAKYNEGHAPNPNPDPALYYVMNFRDNGLTVVKLLQNLALLPFYSENDAETSLRVNRELWRQYWMFEYENLYCY